MNKDSPGGTDSHLAAFHYTQALQLLQARISAIQSSIVSDTTIMVVVILATVVELQKNAAIAANHVDCLMEIVNLRGGLRSLDSHKNIQVKVCRCVPNNEYLYLMLQPCNSDHEASSDLGFALRTL